jgi:hypothetical protein|tara:strand:+ start:2324 stop:2539 length:216 start_codon:yes stop_codon:yes gene_type:complete
MEKIMSNDRLDFQILRQLDQKKMEKIMFNDIDQVLIDTEFTTEDDDLLTRYPNAIEQLEILKSDFLGIKSN